jgi:hypothetical protein|tara:strand:- start:15171 stop:15497 length:327 start_codon:yes stop_codon:yes gene_type:complete
MERKRKVDQLVAIAASIVTPAIVIATTAVTSVVMITVVVVASASVVSAVVASTMVIGLVVVIVGYGIADYRSGSSSDEGCFGWGACRICQGNSEGAGCEEEKSQGDFH